MMALLARFFLLGLSGSGNRRKTKRLESFRGRRHEAQRPARLAGGGHLNVAGHPGMPVSGDERVANGNRPTHAPLDK